MFAASLKILAPRLQFKLDKPNIENTAFKLHYQLTVTFLLLCGLIVCARELLGEHIKCFSEHVITEKSGGWINNYCFFMSTFTIKELYNESKIQNNEIPHPGVGHYNEKTATFIHHKYYQWVPFLLFIQAVCFYMPHYIWKKKEGGRMKALVEGLQFASMSGDDDLKVKTLNTPSKKNLENKFTLNIPSKKTLEKKLDVIKRDILLRLRLNRTWAVWLVAMEVTNLLHVILQIWIVNRFLDGHFIGLGPSVANFKDWDTANVTPLSSIFPKVTKCIYYRYGSSGTLENRDVMCVMALNNVHEKIFTTLWFWFFGLFLVSLAAVIWRVISFFLWCHSKKLSMMLLRKASSAKLVPEHVYRVLQDCYFGDWLCICYLAKNMNEVLFSKVLKLVAQELESQQNENSLGFKKIGFEPMVTHNNMAYDVEDIEKI